MAHFAELTGEERFGRMTRIAEDTRKMLFGSNLLAIDMWRDELSRRQEGLEIIQTMEKAEEAFAGEAQPDGLKRLERTLDVVNQRAKCIFDLMSYISKHMKPD